MIRFEHASVTYPGGVHALKDLTLEIPAGQMLVTVGLSGAGKSTFADELARALGGEQHEIEPVVDVRETVLDGDTGHWSIAPTKKHGPAARAGLKRNGSLSEA